MPAPLKLDLVSDVACPWCAVGLSSLLQALDRLQGQVAVELHLQPFELNPDMGPEGEDLIEHLQRKYGASEAQLAATRAQISARGAEVGFAFRPEGRGRVWNTHDAHRLLYWAGLMPDAGAQLRLKMALLRAYHGRAECMTDEAVLLACVAEAGLSQDEAREVLASQRYHQAVQDAERFYQQAGIRSVPALVINDRHLISGGQPTEVFEQALRELAASDALA